MPSILTFALYPLARTLSLSLPLSVFPSLHPTPVITNSAGVQTSCGPRIPSLSASAALRVILTKLPAERSHPMTTIPPSCVSGVGRAAAARGLSASSVSLSSTPWWARWQGGPGSPPPARGPPKVRGAGLTLGMMMMIGNSKQVLKGSLCFCQTR